MSFFDVTVDARAVIARLREMPQRTQSALEQTVRRLTLELQSRVQRDKLQGQVLRHVTGKLSRSITAETLVSAGSVVGRVFANATAPYAAIHEFGFHGSEHVRAHTRRLTQVFGRPVDMTVHVAPFTRIMNMPERSFLRSTFTEMAGQIERDIKDTVIRAAQGASQ